MFAPAMMRCARPLLLRGRWLSGKAVSSRKRAAVGAPSADQCESGQLRMNLWTRDLDLASQDAPNITRHAFQVVEQALGPENASQSELNRMVAKNLTEKFQRKPNDTGSTEVQCELGRCV